MSIIDQNSGDAINVWVGTQSEYDAITSKDENTLYFIKDLDGDIIVDPPGPEPEPEPQPEPEPEPEPQPEPEPEPQPEPEPEPQPEPEPDLPDNVNHWSGTTPRYEWSEYDAVNDGSTEVSVVIVWNNEIIHQMDYSSFDETPTTIQGNDGRTYVRGTLQTDYGNGYKYSGVIRQSQTPEPGTATPVDENVMVVGNSVYFESNVNQPLEDNPYYQNRSHVPSVSILHPYAIDRIFDPTLANGWDPVLQEMRYSSFVEKPTVSDSHIIFHSPNETSTKMDGTKEYGAVYVYSFENIMKVRDANIEVLYGAQLNEIKEQEGLVIEGWSSLSYVNDKRKVLTHYMLNPTKISRGGWSSEITQEPVEDLADNEEHWSGTYPRYEWTESVEENPEVAGEPNTTVTLIWNNSIVYTRVQPYSEISMTAVTGTDGRNYRRGSLKDTFGDNDQSSYYHIIREGS